MKTPARITAVVLVIPLLGEMFVADWHWGPGGFLLLGGLVFGLSLTYQLAARRVPNARYWLAVGLALMASLPLLWGNFVQAADEVNPWALRFLIVIPVGALAVALSRLRPRGMAIALGATALAQAVVLALVLGHMWTLVPWSAAVWRGFAGNTMVLGAFATSAWLFRRAA